MAKAQYSLPFRGAPVITVEAPIHKTDPEFKHCVDFFLPNGTPIVAARAGVVIHRESRYSKSFTLSREEDVYKGNGITIRHADGEESNYGHIEYHSARVRRGQKVRRGQIIALSGKTGFAHYPHLHFGVYDWCYDNIKINFDEKPSGKHISLKRAMRLANPSE